MEGISEQRWTTPAESLHRHSPSIEANQRPFHAQNPSFCPVKSAKICCHLPVLLSLLLSASAKKTRLTGWFIAVTIYEKKLIHTCRVNLQPHS